VGNIYNIQINTLVTYVWKNRWNIGNRRLQHACINHCNISIYFYNIRMKHLQHTSEISRTYACNTRFSAQHGAGGAANWRGEGGRGSWMEPPRHGGVARSRPT
jgi:hypothetical protein